MERLEADDGIVNQDLKIGRSTMADVINQEALLRNIGFDSDKSKEQTGDSTTETVEEPSEEEINKDEPSA